MRGGPGLNFRPWTVREGRMSWTDHRSDALVEKLRSDPVFVSDNHEARGTEGSLLINTALQRGGKGKWNIEPFPTAYRCGRGKLLKQLKGAEGLRAPG